MTADINKKLHAVLTQRGMMHHKADLVHSITQGRTASSKELTDHEALTLIATIERDHPLAVVKKKESDNATQIRSACYWFRQLGGYTRGDDTLDWIKINDFTMNRTAAKKRMDAMSKAELTTLITQLKRIYSSKLKNRIQ